MGGMALGTPKAMWTWLQGKTLKASNKFAARTVNQTAKTYELASFNDRH